MRLALSNHHWLKACIKWFIFPKKRYLCTFSIDHGNSYASNDGQQRYRKCFRCVVQASSAFECLFRCLIAKVEQCYTLTLIYMPAHASLLDPSQPSAGNIKNRTAQIVTHTGSVYSSMPLPDLHYVFSAKNNSSRAHK